MISIYAGYPLKRYPLREVSLYTFLNYALFKITLTLLVGWYCLQCFDAVGWAAGRASSL